MGDIKDFFEDRYDAAAADRAQERLMFGEILDGKVDDTLTEEYDMAELAKKMKIRERLLFSPGGIWAGTLFEDPEFVKTLDPDAGLTEEEKAEMEALEEAYRQSFVAGPGIVNFPLGTKYDNGTSKK